MPRFNERKYDPRADSSPGIKEPGVVRLTFAEGLCPCGCGERPKSRASTFAMGHDARLRGKLTRAHLTGTPVQYVVGDRGLKAQTAMDVASEHGWQSYLTDAALRREGKNREVLARAVGSKRAVKVGRWSYTGQVIAFYDTPGGDEYEVEYVTRMGDRKRVRVSVDEAKAVKSS